MSTATAIAIRDDQVQFDDLQRKALVHMGVENATDADLAIFMHHCKKTGLDPFARQIHMIGRNTKNQRTQQWETKFTIQTGIDGYRLIARRAAGRQGYGYEDTQWCGPDGQWVDVWTSDESPVAARVVVVRGGERFPAVARYKAYVQTKRDGSPNNIWAQRDAEQLEKCAEALALRKAFPQDLSGIYTEDEMRAQDVREPRPEPQRMTRVTAADVLRSRPEEKAAATAGDDVVHGELVDDEPVEGGEPVGRQAVTRIHAMLTERGVTDRAAKLGILTDFLGRQITSTNELTKLEASRLIDWLDTTSAADFTGEPGFTDQQPPAADEPDGWQR